MMIDTTDQAYEFFVQESIELLQTLEQGLMTLNQQHEMPKLHELMRAAHSIKGGAACVGLMGIQEIAHNLENGIRALYPEDTVFDLELEELLLQAFDCLRAPILEQVETGRCQQEEAIERSQPIFQRLEAKLGHPLDEAAELPEVPMETDMMTFLFSEEVPSGLRRWKNVLAHPQRYNVTEELKSQAEVFATLGKMLSLPGFTAIAETTIQALELNPKYTLKIGQIALSDLWKSQKAVLAGDRVQGGKTSPVLVKLAKYRVTSKAQSKKRASPVSSTVASCKTCGVKPPAKSSPSAVKNITQTSKNKSYSVSTSHPTRSVKLGVDKSSNLAVYPVQESPTSNPNSALQSHQLISKNLASSPEPYPQKLVVSPQKKPESIEQSDSDLKLGNREEQTVAPISETSNSNSQLTLGVRVDLNRLELINNLIGDLTTQDNSFLLQSQQLKSSLEILNNGWHKFQKFIVKLQENTTNNQDLSSPLNLSGSGNLELLQEDLQKILDEMERVEKMLYDMKLLNFQTQQILKKRQQTLHQVQKQLTETRMIPVESLLKRFPRMVRDLSVRQQKQVELTISGQNTLIDKAVLEKLYDPLVHIVRNAFDHGIESHNRRLKAGKEEVGKIEIKAYHQGNYTYIEVQDDGQGIDLDKILKKAVDKNIIALEEAKNLSKSQVYDLLFLPDFSTKNKVSELSGRGVGLEAVRHQIEALKGSITIQSEVGEGTKFILRLPWTLTITKLLIFRVSERLFSIPMDTLGAIVSVPVTDIESQDGEEVYNWLGQKVPLIQTMLLDYHYPTISVAPSPQTVHSWEPNRTGQFSGKVMVVLLSEGLETVGLKIDQILMEQNLTIKPFGKTLNAPSYFYGCTILGDGHLVPVIDTPVLLERWLEQKRSASEKVMLVPTDVSLKIQDKTTILVIDDSLTTRQTLSSMLQQSGYTVIQAKHGKEGLAKLRQHSKIQLVICDLEMPEMNGLEFLSYCRREFSRQKLPVLMLTSRTSDRYRKLAQQLGSSGYMTKPWVKQELMEILQNHLCEESN